MTRSYFIHVVSEEERGRAGGTENGVCRDQLPGRTNVNMISMAMYYSVRPTSVTVNLLLI